MDNIFHLDVYYVLCLFSAFEPQGYGALQIPTITIYYYFIIISIIINIIISLQIITIINIITFFYY